jgi:hypothetical protein
MQHVRFKGLWPGLVFAWTWFLVLVIPGWGAAQLLVSASPAVPALMQGAAAWADYDGDSLQDLFICGLDSGGVRRSYLLHNTGSSMDIDTAQSLVQVAFGDAAWGDMDGDGDQDLVVSGETAPRQGATVVYENVGGTMTALSTPNLPGLIAGRTAWADFDQDGNLDLFLTGFSVMEGFRGMIAQNDGSGGFVRVEDSLYTAREWSAVGVGDFDRDGLPDIAFADISPRIEEGLRAVVLRNQGGMQFSGVSHFIPGFYGGNLDFADADGDGDLDLLCSGMGVEPVTSVFLYQSGQFQVTSQGAVVALGHGEARWADFNLDGDLDFVSCGRKGLTVESLVYRKISGNYTLIQGPSGMPAVYNARLAWGDWNADGYPDFLMMGQGADELPAAYIGSWNAAAEEFEF